MVDKCPSCGTRQLQQQLNPRYFNCLACGAWFNLHIYIPKKKHKWQVERFGRA